MRILILGGDNFQALRLVRDLGKKYHLSVAGLCKSRTLAYYSRYCKDHIVFDEFDLNSMNRVLKYIKLNGVKLVIPTTERCCFIVNEYRDIIEKSGCTLACSEMNELELAFNKLRTADFCTQKNIPAPRLFEKAETYSGQQLLVRKPVSSNKLLSNGRLERTGSPAYFKSMEELPKFDPDFIVQEYIEGISVGFFALCAKGDLRTSFSHQRILDTNPSGSGSCVRKSITMPDRDLIKISGQIIKDLKWNGPIMLEFLLDSNNDLFLLEINGRLWGSYCLTTFSGIQFSKMLVSQYLPDENITFTSKTISDKIVVNEILLVSRWLQILKGKSAQSSKKFPKRVSIFRELKYLFHKKEVLSDWDPLPLFRFLWKK